MDCSHSSGSMNLSDRPISRISSHILRSTIILRASMACPSLLEADFVC